MSIESSYDHPYDSPIEDIFAWHCKKYLRDDIAFNSQVEITTKHGKFRLDFLLVNKARKIAVECDGEDFHDAHRDELRDAIILGEGHVDTIYRFRGCDLLHSPNECIWLMSLLNSQLFTRRAIMKLEHLNKLEIIMPGDLSSLELILGRVCTDYEEYKFNAVRTTIYMNPNLHPHWKALYRFACDNPDLTLDELFDKDIEENLLHLLKFENKGVAKGHPQTKSLSKSNLTDLGDKLKKSNPRLKNKSSLFVGLVSASIDDKDLFEVLTSQEDIFKGKYLFGIPIDEDLNE